MRPAPKLSDLTAEHEEARNFLKQFFTDKEYALQFGTDPVAAYEELRRQRAYRGPGGQAVLDMALDSYYNEATGKLTAQEIGAKYGSIDKASVVAAFLTPAAKTPNLPDATDAYIRMLAQGRIGQSLRSGGGF